MWYLGLFGTCRYIHIFQVQDHKPVTHAKPQVYLDDCQHLEPEQLDILVLTTVVHHC